MNFLYGIKNFRVFDKDGADFYLKPITILTGANCSGKSSLVKSLILIKDFINQMRDPHSCPEKTRLSFSDGSININGIKSVLNFNSKDSKDLVFTISKTVLSDNERIVMDLFFSEKDGDFFNDGWLNRIRFSCIIDGSSDVFLDVSYKSNGRMSVDTLDLSGNIYRLFCRNLDLASYNWLFDDCGHRVWDGFWDEKFKTDEDYKNLDAAFDHLVDSIKSNPLNRSIVLNDRIEPPHEYSIRPNERYQREREINRFRNRLFVDGLEYDCWKRFKENGILMYLPILEEIGPLSPSELIDYFDKVKIDSEYIENHISSQYIAGTYDDSFDYKVLFNKVSQSFSDSGYKTFWEFYGKMQAAALRDVGCLDEKGIGGLSWRTFFHSDRFGAVNDNSGFMEKVSAFISMLTGLHYMETYENKDYPNTVLLRPRADYYMVYRVLTYLQRMKSSTHTIKYHESATSPVYEYKDDTFTHWRDPNWYGLADIPESKVFGRFRSFLIDVIKGLLQCEDFISIKSVGSFLCPVLRTYSLYDNNDPMSSVLKSYELLKNQVAPIDMYDKYVPGTFINKWVKELGIGRSMIIQPNDDSTGIHLFIIDKKGRKVSSADYGHGVTQILYVLFNIENAILYKILYHHKGMLEKKPERNAAHTLCFEEPEVSLHPSWQSKLAKIFRDAYDKHGIHFIIETHSEYLTRATQAMVATTCKTEKDLKAFPFIVYYMESDGTAYDLEYTLSGRFRNSFGPGFYDEASRSSVEILKREKRIGKSR